MVYEAERGRIYTELSAALGINRSLDAALIREADERALEARQEVGLYCEEGDDCRITHPTAAQRRARLGVPPSVGTAEIALWLYLRTDPVGDAIEGWLESPDHRAVLDNSAYTHWGLGIYTEFPPNKTNELDRRWYFIMWLATESIDPAVYAQPSEIINERVRFEAGFHWGYRFGYNGNIISKKKLTLTAASGASTKGRGSISGRSDKWLLMTDGFFKDHWVHEKGFTARENEAEMVS